MQSMLEELQNLSREKKRQVMIVSTIVIMAIVIGLWLIYFNGIVSGPAKSVSDQGSAVQAAAPAPTAAPAATNGPGLWQNIKDFFGTIGHMFTSPSQYKIQPR